MNVKNIGIIGCGNISGIYFKNLTKTFRNTRVIACADIIRERAEQKAAEYGVKACTVDELLKNPEIDIVVNLTIPKAHYEVCDAALSCGKHVYVEKPLCLTREDGKKLIRKAKEKNLLIGSAPDTFLGAGIQTCRKLIDDGWIGKPVAATAFMLCHGHESWHPDPEFYYEIGGGPMFDMGPYYLTALINLNGSVKKVTGLTNITFPQRTITSEKKYGKVINVEVPTHVAGLMEFCNGAVGTIITSFDVWDTQLPRIEIYGSLGTLIVPDPNTFGGPVFIKRENHTEFHQIPLTHPYAENSRGLGVADMAQALITDKNHRASGELAYHVLDIMHAFNDSANTGKHIILESTCSMPEALSG
jgi:predicted dehydrogenase